LLESDEDRLELLEELGESLSLDGRELFGIFDVEYLEDLEGPGIASSAPMVTCRSSDVSHVVQGAVLKRISGDQYKVRELEPDGTGMTLLRLRDHG